MVGPTSGKIQLVLVVIRSKISILGHLSTSTGIIKWGILEDLLVFFI